MADKITKIDPKHFHEITLEILRAKNYKKHQSPGTLRWDFEAFAKEYTEDYKSTYNSLIDNN